jgi:hypothetical protein
MPWELGLDHALDQSSPSRYVKYHSGQYYFEFGIGLVSNVIKYNQPLFVKKNSIKNLCNNYLHR